MFALNQLAKKRIKNGRLFVYENDTTDLADIYTYEGSEFVQAQNPIYFVDGITENTYFLKNKIYDAVAQEYKGDSSIPSGDLRPEMWVQSFSTKIGFEYDPLTNNEDIATVFTIANLKNYNVGGFVKVIGYWNDHDCEQRLYMWDSTSVNTPDNGLIVASNVSDTGHWLLITNEIMKSEYYGVYGTHQENLPELFHYNDLYGTYSLVSPKTILLAPGDYGDGFTLYNAGGKKVVFSTGASIAEGSSLKCLSFEGTGLVGFIRVGYDKNGQWHNEDASCPVRLSNVRHVIDLANSDSNKLIFDVAYDRLNPELKPVHVLNTTKSITNKVCVFEQLFGTYGGNLIFDNCEIFSEGMLNDGNIHFRNCAVKDKWFAESVRGWINPDPNYDANLSLIPSNFIHAETYLKYLTYTNPTAVTANCYGQDYDTGFTFPLSISSLQINGLKMSDGSLTIGVQSAELNDCSINSGYFSSPYLTMYDTNVKAGYLGTDGQGDRIYRNFNGCKLNKEVDLRMENCTAFNISAIDTDFGSVHRETFYSDYGLNIPTGFAENNSTTYFKNCRGIAGPDPVIPKSIMTATPGTIPYFPSATQRYFVFTDEVGRLNFANRELVYEPSPFLINELFNWHCRIRQGIIASADTLGQGTLSGVASASCKYHRNPVDNKVYYPTQIDITIDDHSPLYQINLFNGMYLGDVTLYREER